MDKDKRVRLMYMKKRIALALTALVFVLACSFTSLAAGWLQSGNDWYYYDENGQLLVNTITPDGYRVGPDGKWIPDEPSLQKALGMEGKVRIDDPKTDPDNEYNFALAFMQGDWEYTTDRHYDWYSSRSRGPLTYAAIAGAFVNQDVYILRRNGKYYVLLMDGITPRFSREELMAQQQAAYARALEIYRFMHSNVITDGMSQYEIAQRYADHCRNLGVRPSGIADAVHTPYEAVAYMQFDSAYSGLVNNTADCGGRAAMFNMLLNMEGIKAYGLGGHIPNTPSGHMVTYAILDGREYTVDWGNGYGIRALGDPYLEIYSWSLEAARAAAGY